jgi:hypothetical protein
MDSRDARSAYDLLEAVRRAISRTSDPAECLDLLHDDGFMVVPIPQPALEPEPIEPAPPQPEPASALEFRMTNENASWSDWERQFNHLWKDGERGSLPLAPTAKAEFDAGSTPAEAVETIDGIPF